MANCPDYTSESAIIGAYRPDSESLAGSPINSLINFNYDNFTIDYSDLTKDVFKFYLGTVLSGTIEISYLNANKTEMISGRRL